MREIPLSEFSIPNCATRPTTMSVHRDIGSPTLLHQINVGSRAFQFCKYKNRHLLLVVSGGDCFNYLDAVFEL